MAGGRPKSILILSDDEREALLRLVRRGKVAQRTALRARIVLSCAGGSDNQSVARRLGVTPATVGKWRGRFVGRRLDGLLDEPRRGAPRTVTDDRVEAVVVRTLEAVPRGSTHWSTRGMAAASGLGRSTIGRIWRAFGLQPHRTETFKFSTDPDLVAKVRDVVGLYLSPPDRAIVLSVDEKTQIQALDRTAPMLPLRPGQVERHTHDYKRNGTTSLFAAIDVATGHVTNATRERHTAVDFLAFLRRIARTYPDQELHVILDNVSTHKTPAVRAWLERQPRITFHFTPTSASWMNQIETWFGILSRQAIRRGSFGSVKELIAGIDLFTGNWNAGATPFAWVRTADEILAKAVRKRPVISESRH